MIISTSILDSKNRIESVLKLNETKTSYIHVDVMDGIFVPNTNFCDINEIERISSISKYPLDVHLMVKNPLNLLNVYNNLNIEFITIHLEIEEDINFLIDKIHGMGYKVGVALKVETDISLIEMILDKIDMVLLMSVEPGSGGQGFRSEVIDKINNLKKIILKHKLSVLIEVDGGINDNNIGYLSEADIAVVGSYIIGSDDYDKSINGLLGYKN